MSRVLAVRWSGADGAYLRFYKRIDEAYTCANKTLLKLLLEEQHLVSRLRCVLP